MNHAQDRQLLQTQTLVCAGAAVGVALWQGLELGFACGLGALAIIVPNLVFSIWSSLQSNISARSEAGGDDAYQRRAQQVLGMAGLRLIGTMTLMVIAFIALPAQALWVLTGIVVAVIAQVVAALATGIPRRERGPRPVASSQIAG